MFGEYDQVNFGNDLTIKTKDALFYYQLGRGMYDSGFRNFDSISVDTYLSDKADTRKVFSAYGGYPEVEKLKSLVDVDNVEAYFDRISKLNTLSDLCEQFSKLSRIPPALIPCPTPKSTIFSTISSTPSA